MLTVLSVIGTRPEAIKMAPVILELKKHNNKIKSLVCTTGQHDKMLEQALSIFHIKPDFDLALMESNQTLSKLTAKLIDSLDTLFCDIKPDWVLAQGDTTTVMATSLVSFYHKIKFGHVEAGLRTDDKWNPYPEEINRRIADLLADVYFAPTERAKYSLLQMGCASEKIEVTGNTVVDALLFVSELPFLWTNSPLSTIPEHKKIILITAHRRESFGETFKEICLALRDIAIACMNMDIHFVYPVHLNPNVQKPVREILSDLPNLSLMEPLDYTSLVNLMKKSILILTDSGGIQEEAPTFGTPVLVMREKTERPEGIEAGVSMLVGIRREKIFNEALDLIMDETRRLAMASNKNPYGDGMAAKRIVSSLLRNS